jgi:hypothetical protein
VLRLDPNHLWSLNELCNVLTMRGKNEHLHGRDPSASFAQAAEHCERAIALEPTLMYAKVNLVLLSRNEADHLATAGRSPEAAVTRGLAAVDEMEKQNPANRWIPWWRARLLRISVAHALASGGELAGPLSSAEAALRPLDEVASFPAAHEMRGLIAMTRAEVELATGRSPEAALQEAREGLARAVAAMPWDADDRLWLARVELLTFRWAERQGHTKAAPLDAAFAALAPLLDAPHEDPMLYTTLAEVHEGRARLRARHGGGVGTELERGLVRANEALVRNPHFAPALLVQGRLWLLRARTARETGARRVAAARAIAAFGAAVRSNPLLERTERASLEEASRLAGGGNARR